ncbi:ATP-dependent RNA helicase DHX33 [Aedes albopictus]|uniref:RNA helicase n=1 Tax=Aedes albopictus TaxID=7160 RepID=A0ABM1XZY4_AEDAL|nr:ATP-dependent RNA helicase DHX33 [Aedes albopictus]
MKRAYPKEAGAENNGPPPPTSPFRQPPTSAAIIQQHRQSLPIYNIRKTIVDKVRECQTVILIGETGSGKSTQLPQFLYEGGVHGGRKIAITQPRRVAAISVAKRVAMEQNGNVGDVVGYSVRFEDVTSPNTKIKFMTDGTLMREALSDQLLKNYSVVILDEAHERTIATDVLFGIVKKAQSTRRLKMLDPLKIIIMSATMNVNHFAKYFGNCPTLYLKGKNHVVRVYQAMDNINYLEACITTIFQIHEKEQESGDILVFLTGQEEIEAATALVRRLAKQQTNGQFRMRVHPMYAAMSQQAQMDVFLSTPPNTRKVILATNIAETSLTISGIKYVIDCGKAKQRAYDPTSGIDTLKVSWISKAQAWQRTGRAGRLEDGFCYRTYSKKDFEALSEHSTPEILRCSISASTLQLLALGIDCREFDFLDKPPPSAIESAVQELKNLGAIFTTKAPSLTPLGRRMAKLPLEPKYAKIVLSAPDFGCLNEILTIVAMLSGENVFLNNSQRREQQLAAHSKFYSKCGDHLTLLKVFEEFKSKDKPRKWCGDNFLMERHLSHAASVRTQLLDICSKLGIQPSSCGDDPIPVVKCLLTGLFLNIAELQRDNSYLCLSSRTPARIHPSSVLCGRARPRYVLFTEQVATGSRYLRTVTEVEPEWVGETAPHCPFLDRISSSGGGGARGSTSSYAMGTASSAMKTV